MPLPSQGNFLSFSMYTPLLCNLAELLVGFKMLDIYALMARHIKLFDLDIQSLCIKWATTAYITKDWRSNCTISCQCQYASWYGTTLTYSTHHTLAMLVPIGISCISFFIVCWNKYSQPWPLPEKNVPSIVGVGFKDEYNSMFAQAFWLVNNLTSTLGICNDFMVESSFDKRCLPWNLHSHLVSREVYLHCYVQFSSKKSWLSLGKMCLFLR